LSENLKLGTILAFLLLNCLGEGRNESEALPLCKAEIKIEIKSESKFFSA